jgi:superfamily II DNA helicase RecQ
MPIRIFTIPFNEETQTFHDDLVQQFCVNKRIHKIQTKFFERNNCPFWTVVIFYGQILNDEIHLLESKKSNPENALDDQQKALLLKLKEWRREQAELAGFPVYLIAKNAHFVSLILNKCTTLESLKLVQGFGKSKIEKYGKGIITIIHQFYNGK